MIDPGRHDPLGRSYGKTDQAELSGLLDEVLAQTARNRRRLRVAREPLR